MMAPAHRSGRSLAPASVSAPRVGALLAYPALPAKGPAGLVSAAVRTPRASVERSQDLLASEERHAAGTLPTRHSTAATGRHHSIPPDLETDPHRDQPCGFVGIELAHRRRRWDWPAPTLSPTCARGITQ